MSAPLANAHNPHCHGSVVMETLLFVELVSPIQEAQIIGRENVRKLASSLFLVSRSHTIQGCSAVYYRIVLFSRIQHRSFGKALT